MIEEPQEGPKWLKELEEKREKRVKARLGHEAGAGSPCLTCEEKCPGLDLHFWRKICKNCKCGKENHDVNDDDIYGWAQFQLLGSKPNKPKKLVLPGRKDAVELEWTPKGQTEVVESYLKDLPVNLLPIKGSAAAQERKQLLQKQIPLHDIDPTLCHALSEQEIKQMNDYIAHVKQNSVGVGHIMKLNEILKNRQQSANAQILSSRAPMQVPQLENIILQGSDRSNLLKTTTGQATNDILLHNKGLKDLSLDEQKSLDVMENELIPNKYKHIRNIVYGTYPENDNSLMQQHNTSDFPSVSQQNFKNMQQNHPQNMQWGLQNTQGEPQNMQMPQHNLKNMQENPQNMQWGNQNTLNEPQNMQIPQHNLKNMQENPQNMQWGYQNTLSEPQNMQMSQHLKNMQENPQNIQRDPQNMQWGYQNTLNEPQNMQIPQHNLKNMQQDPQNLKWNPQNMQWGSQNTQGDPQNTQGEPQNMQMPQHNLKNMQIPQQPVANQIDYQNSTNIRGVRDVKYPSNVPDLPHLSGRTHKNPSNIAFANQNLDSQPFYTKISPAEDIHFPDKGKRINDQNLLPHYANSRITNTENNQKPIEYDIRNVYPDMNVNFEPHLNIGDLEINSEHLDNIASLKGDSKMPHYIPGKYNTFAEQQNPQKIGNIKDLAYSTYDPSSTNFNNENFLNKGLNPQKPNELNITEQNLNPTSVNVGIINDIERYPAIKSAVQRENNIFEPALPRKNVQFDLNPQEILPNCHKCKKMFDDSAIVIGIDRTDDLWHADCFKCNGCNQNLADLMYFYDKESDDIYCGRDYAKIRGIPRCQACDELIFVKEYCLAENSTFHVKHFCCFECDEPLAGQNYVMEESQPLCLPCYENVKAEKCNACLKVIKPDEQGANLNGIHFHADDGCFACKMCKKPLLGAKLLLKNNNLYCSAPCFGADK